jgi:superfamily II DNA or RNA helicase
MRETLPQPGQIARVRQRLYLVDSSSPAQRPGDASLVRMSCLDDDAQGQPLEVLWEKEVDAELRTQEAWDEIARRGFDAPKLFAAYLNTLRWNCVTSTDPQLFQSPFRAGIRLDAYQLEPLRKALLLPRVNLFIADDVGLGKTIEAGLIARELLLRKKVRDIVVSCPPSMLLQWKDELEARFGLVFEILDKDFMKRIRRERGFGVNPWSTHSRFLVSHRLLIDEAYAGPMRDWLGDFRPGSLLILDEAHHAAPASGQKYAIDSQITRAARDLAARFEHRLFLSATPHNGHSNSFSALLEILDPQRFCRGVPVQKRMLDDIMVRRLKEDIRSIQGGFAFRRVVQIDIDGLPEDAPELRLSTLLDEYRTLRESRLQGQTKRNQAAAGLLIVGLQQRLLSSVEAFARTLRVHRRTVQRQWEAVQTEAAESTDAVSLDLLFEPVGSDDDRATLAEDELQAEVDAQVESATVAGTISPTDDGAAATFAREQKLLDEMTEIAETHRCLPDGRVRKLLEWIRAEMCPDLGKAGAKWTDLRILIFTEYDDTKRYLREQLESAIVGSDRAEDRIRVYHGPTPTEEREAIKHAFNASPQKHPLRILIATDAAREGLNLQAQCWNLFHFDLPWNPSRMEQRNGRIDRKLQPNDEVFCRYFTYLQRPEDRILRALVKKTETIKKELGSLAQVVDARLASTLKGGIRRDSVSLLESKIEKADIDAGVKNAVEQELEITRTRQVALKEQNQRLQDIIDKSKSSVGFETGAFRSAVECALDMIGAGKLEPVETPAGPERSQLPALDWIDTLDTLRPPRPRDQDVREWRRSAPIRPIVFDAPELLDDEVVHLHLEHRVVQRLLARFIAQGFVHHDLSRACLTQTTDAIPRVILLGRLSLYGLGAARLHEELIPVTARWIDPEIRKDKLAPYAREAESKTVTLLEGALAAKSSARIAAKIQKDLQGAAARDVGELLPHLEVRGKEYAEDAKKKLSVRADKEAKDMKAILENQRTHIKKTADSHAKPVVYLDLFGEDERRQLESNRRWWDKRLTSLEKELEFEPQRIRDVYQVKAQRVEPVGLIYLWPVTG